MAKNIVVIIMILILGMYVRFFLDYTKDYPQCRASSDFVTCVEIARQK